MLDPIYEQCPVMKLLVQEIIKFQQIPIYAHVSRSGWSDVSGFITGRSACRWWHGNGIIWCWIICFLENCVEIECKHNTIVTAVPSIRISCRKNTCWWCIVCLHKMETDTIVLCLHVWITHHIFIYLFIYWYMLIIFSEYRCF
jgi:hypothetical protein